MTEKTFTIPVGPQHPALKEPELWSFTLDGEIVTDGATLELLDDEELLEAHGLEKP